MPGVDELLDQLSGRAPLPEDGGLRCSCPLTKREVQSLASLLTDHQEVRSLYLRGCGLDDACADILARVVAFNPTLQHLLLEDNAIGAQGAQYLANALRLYNAGTLRRLALDREHRVVQEGNGRMAFRAGQACTWACMCVDCSLGVSRGMFVFSVTNTPSAPALGCTSMEARTTPDSTTSLTRRQPLLRRRLQRACSYRSVSDRGDPGCARRQRDGRDAAWMRRGGRCGHAGIEPHPQVTAPPA